MATMAKLHLRCNAQTGKHILTIEYSSPESTPNELHEEEHQHLLRQALRALWGRDEVPEGVEVGYKRLPCPEIARADEAADPVLDPAPVPVPEKERR